MLKYLLFCTMVVSGYVLYSNIPQKHGPGVMAPDAPTIEPLSWQQPFFAEEIELIPQKKISGNIRVVKKKVYYFDRHSSLMPIDIVAGWDELSDERNLNYLYYTLNNRHVEIDLVRPPLEPRRIFQKTDLWHLLPSTAAIDEKLKKLREGNILHIKGLLVDLRTPHGENIRTETGFSSNKNYPGFFIWVEELRLE